MLMEMMMTLIPSRISRNLNSLMNPCLMIRMLIPIWMRLKAKKSFKKILNPVLNGSRTEYTSCVFPILQCCDMDVLSLGVQFNKKRFASDIQLFQVRSISE